MFGLQVYIVQEKKKKSSRGIGWFLDREKGNIKYELFAYRLLLYMYVTRKSCQFRQGWQGDLCKKQETNLRWRKKSEAGKG